MHKLQNRSDAKNICFSIANSPLVKTAILEDPNWGRIAMAIGKSGASVKMEKLSIYMGPNIILNKGKVDKKYDENICAEYMKNENIDIS